jgi:hypothetical protein
MARLRSAIERSRAACARMYTTPLCGSSAAGLKAPPYIKAAPASAPASAVRMTVVRTFKRFPLGPEVLETERHQPLELA